VRFRPPFLAPSGDARWVLRRAFGPGGRGAPPDDPDAAVELAYRLDLAHRIAARQPASALRAEVGLRPAGRLFARHETIRRRAGALAAAAEPIASAAAAGGIPLVALKFLALRLDGLAPDGVRRAGDLDFLVRDSDLGRSVAFLAELGYHDAGFPPSDHAVHLVDDSGLAIDLHRQLPGVRLAPGAEPAGLSDLERAGLLVPARGSPLRLPCRDVTVAHLAVHGLVHHGWTARGYPFLRMVADLADLGVGPGDGTTQRACRWIQDELAGDEVEGLARLVARLRAGDEDLLALARPGEADAILLRHFLACAIDDDYARSLKLSAAAHRGAGGPRSIGAALTRAVFVTDAQIDLLYGRPRHRWGYVAWRLFRPVDLMLRALRYAHADLRVRINRSKTFNNTNSREQPGKPATHRESDH